MVLSTIVHHVSEKNDSEMVVHMPDVHAVYQKILDANAGVYPNVVLLPEYNAHDSWADEAAWITANFRGIPVMVDCAGGWDTAQYVTPERLQALIDAGVDVRWIRIAELISYYEEWLMLPFPDAYVLSLFEFCKTKGIKVYFCEWKIAAFDKAISLVGSNYTEVVWLGLKTNTGDMEPAQGFKYVIDKMRDATPALTHFGATVESWYWETRHRGESARPEANVFNPDNMPVSWMVCHAQEAISMPNIYYSGAELIQFEAYWWFFEHTTGVPRSSLKTVHNYINTHVAVEENSTVLLETLKAEWVGGPVKTDIEWLDGHVSAMVGWDLQPSKFDMKNVLKSFAISVYPAGCSSPNDKLWVKYENVNIDILVKTQGTTLDRAAFNRERMRVEVERILYMYSKVGPLWDPGTGIWHRRVIPGIDDIVQASIVSQSEDANYSRLTIQVKLKINPKKSWTLWIT